MPFFKSSTWPDATAGLPSPVLRDVESAAFTVSIMLPAEPTVDDLADPAIIEQLGILDRAIAVAREQSTHAEHWPQNGTRELYLVLWAIGLSAHLSIRRLHDETAIAELLGATVPIAATGNHTPDPARLAAPLEGPGSVVHSFCTGCGQYYELTDAGARRIAASDGRDLPASLEGHFIQVGNCSQCDGNDNSVEFKPIDGLFN